jgi:hypothetical protein
MLRWSLEREGGREIGREEEEEGGMEAERFARAYAYCRR